MYSQRSSSSLFAACLRYLSREANNNALLEGKRNETIECIP